MVYQIDRAVGAVLDSLDAEGLTEETIVVFTSDHGDFLGDHGYLRKGLAASDALLRVPFLMRAPGFGLPERIDTATSNCDVLPTLAAMCGIPAPECLHGIDFRHALPDNRAYAMSSRGEYQSMNYTLYDIKYRFTWYPHSGFIELFDHATDPAESNNIAGAPNNKMIVAEFQDTISKKLVEFHNPILGRVGAW